MKVEFLPPVKRYMNAIEWRLRVDRATKVRVMTELASDFQARRDAGQSDEAIMAELGSPDKVAAEFNESFGAPAYVPASPWRWVFVVVAVLALLTGLSRWAFRQLMLPSNAIGVIGGADGPTAVFVTGGYRFTLVSLLPWLQGCVAGFLLLGWCRNGDKRRLWFARALCGVPALAWLAQFLYTTVLTLVLADAATFGTVFGSFVLSLFADGIALCFFVLGLSFRKTKR